MSASHFPVMRALAVQAATSLARYERHVRKLAATWLDMELYATVSGEIDEIQRCCSALAEVSGPRTALLISHAELVHVLWRSTQRGRVVGRDEVDKRLREHLACIDMLARNCLGIAGRPGAAGARH